MISWRLLDIDYDLLVTMISLDAVIRLSRRLRSISVLQGVVTHRVERSAACTWTMDVVMCAYGALTQLVLLLSKNPVLLLVKNVSLHQKLGQILCISISSHRGDVSRRR